MRVCGCDMRKVMQSGQCFSIQALQRGYLVQSGDKACMAYQEGRDTRVSCLSEDIAYWERFFGGQDGYADLVEMMQMDGGYLRDAAMYGEGLRVLQQDLFECLISFIISQRKTVQAIGTSILRLRTGLGIWKRGVEGIEYWAFPTPEAIAGADLAGYGLGYREPYVRRAAQCFGNADFVRGLQTASCYDEAVSVLKRLDGVGDKVASCVALYALGFQDAFPRDVWINRVLDQQFDGGKLFPFERYKGYLGAVQLFLYYYGRCSNEGR